MIKKPDYFDSMKSAAAALGIPLQVLKKAKGAGCPAFRASRVYGEQLKVWLAKHPDIMATKEAGDLRSQKLAEEVRKLKLANDTKAGRVVDRAWVASCMQTASGRLQTFRARSEAEHPVRLAAIPTGDVAGHRAVVQSIWDEVFAAMQSLASCFDEPAKLKPKQ